MRLGHKFQLSQRSSSSSVFLRILGPFLVAFVCFESEIDPLRLCPRDCLVKQPFAMSECGFDDVDLTYQETARGTL